MTGLGLLVLAIWLVLIFARGDFWRCLDRDEVPSHAAARPPRKWPSVVAVMPARDEAALIEASVGSLLAQDYPGEFHIVLVDDHSSDATAQKSRDCAAASRHPERLTIVSAAPLPSGWAGKVWAMDQGLRAARKQFTARYILFTDADVAHPPDNLRRTVARAEAGDYGLVSLMATWRCESAAEKWLIPAFTYFFQMLYPFRWVSDPGRETAAAAGNCMLARVDLLEQAGGVASIATAIIDDCAFGARMKSVGPIWLGLSHRLRSLRSYPRFADIHRMVARSAYAQLRFSPLWLAGAAIGLALTFFAPVLLAFFAPGVAGLCGVAAYALMSVSFAPIQRFYGLPRWRAAVLPLIAALYMVYMLDSALQYWRGRGGMWKGRAQAHVTDAAEKNARAGRDGDAMIVVENAAAGALQNERVTAESLRSGKSGGDENFPVASLLIAAPLRPVILAFYDFVRAGDDVADHPTLPPEQKHALLDQLDRSLTGESDAEPLGVNLRVKLAERGLTDRHARDLLNAFRRDVDKNRTEDWDDLIDYCRLSAMPVGRFLLDVHGESHDLWPASDAVCAALQINNHLQDCGKDFATLDRVYIPRDALAAAGACVEDLRAPKATPALRKCLRDLALRNRALLEEGARLPHDIRDFRLGMEIAVVTRHAFDIVDLLIARDPLSECVKLSKGQMLYGATVAAAGEALSRLAPWRAA